eukprot:CAMPEP_0184289740 /NCGR_PEP_ID=MMETSP1049-20130417/2105_1 /TAXON_ID=77928 /ORGANISM="Proteomonas sulcata, Strain CCMP704" /LENGTH=203 /DNA_ID=CAMNT_0026596629 /DNA_START=1 /DNA_END=612 /DNA_ORIENTATION=-
MATGLSVSQANSQCIQSAGFDVCASNESSIYDPFCCPSDFFWGGSQEPARIVYDYKLLKDVLRDDIEEMQKWLFLAENGIADIKRLSFVLRRNITEMITESQSTVQEIADGLLEVGSCQYFNQVYEDFRIPVCDRFAIAIEAFWILCYLVGMMWCPFFPIIMRNAKIAMLNRGLGKVAPRKLNKIDKKSNLNDDELFTNITED